jgi:hypothetical protein
LKSKHSKEQRVDEGVARNAAWRALTPVEQLSELDKRFGKGLGASNQRKKLAVVLEKQVKK